MRHAIAFALLLTATAAIGDGLFKSGGEFSPFEKKRYTVTKSELNKPVSPHKVHFYVQTSGNQTERKLSLIATVGRPSTRHTGTKKKQPGQVKPYMALWQIRNADGSVQRQWEPSFRNRTRSAPGDEYMTTIFALHESELKRSHLLLYFEDVDGDGTRDDVTFDVDMSNFDWSSTLRFVVKPIVQ